MGFFRFILSLVYCCCFSMIASAQPGTYILNGSATQDNCNCYTLTQPLEFQNGSVWNATKINLENSFDFTFNVYLGCPDLGADGIVFILQPISTSIGQAGGGMGFDGIVPSLGISLDTYQNLEFNDPAFDHISIQSMGRVSHVTDLVPFVQASGTSPDIEDCQWHTLRISWDPFTQLLKTFFDGTFRQQAAIDLIGTVFNNDPMVYWGFSGATGGSVNLQRFCTALNPSFITNANNGSTCLGTPVSFTNNSESFAPISTFHWDFGDNTTSAVQSPPPHDYQLPGIYEIKLAITGMDGCKSDTVKKTIAVGDYPVADFEVFDTCAGFAPRIIERSHAAVGNITEWHWLLDGTIPFNAQQPILADLEPGPHTLSLRVKTNHGCESPPLEQQTFLIKARPTIVATAGNGCVDLPILFSGTQMDNATWITQWEWDFGDGEKAFDIQTSHVYHETGNYLVTLKATESNGCTSETFTLPIFVSKAFPNAGPDTTILSNVPLQLQGSGGGTYEWSPSTGLNNPEIQNPIATLTDDITYTLKVTNNEGCVGTDDVKISVFKGSAIYVPGAFTPNNDALNDRLTPTYKGIRKLDYFAIYNRWGELVFKTGEQDKGWDGNYKGMAQNTGSFVWMIKATDFAGKVYELSGTTTIIR